MPAAPDPLDDSGVLDEEAEVGNDIVTAAYPYDRPEYDGVQDDGGDPDAVV